MTPQNGGVHITTTSGAVSFASDSPGARQEIRTLTLPHADLTLKIAETLNGVLDVLGLNDRQRQEALQTIQELRDAAEEPTTEPTRLKQLYNKASTVAVEGTAPLAGSAITELVKHALHSLGLA